MKLMRKINKEFDEKCIKIRNRIQRLKNEEEDCLKQRINFKKKEKHDKLIREDKKRRKIEVKKVKEERNKGNGEYLSYVLNPASTCPIET